MEQTIITDCKLLSHSGGSKFYEVIQFHHVDAKRFVLVKRWGKNGVRQDGGGETKVEIYTDIRKCQAAAHKIVEEKKKGRPGQGQYAVIPVGFGLHSRPAEMTHGAVYSAIKDHYSGSEVIEELRTGLKLGQLVAAETAIDDVIVEEPPAAPIERGDSWGSW